MPNHRPRLAGASFAAAPLAAASLVAASLAALGCASTGSSGSSGSSGSTGSTGSSPGGAAAAPAPGPQQSMVRIESPDGVPVEVRMTRDDRGVEAVYPATPERVWEVLPSVYDSLGVQVTTMVSGSRTLGVQSVRMRRRLAGEAMSRALSCGSSGPGIENADAYDVFVTVMSVVQPVGEGRAVLRTWVQGSAQSVGTSGGRVQCTSTGALERRISGLVAARLGR